MNEFISITSNGGYVGRWCWCNTGSHFAADGLWGSITSMPDNISIAWAGSIWVIRALIK